MWKIGSVEIRNPFVAAPLAGISNPVYREVMHEYGAGLVVSEMISDKALHYHNARTFDMCATSKKEHPVSLQLFGNDPATMGEASAYLTAHTDCDIIDINMGCPVPKVIKARSGSYLMAHSEEAYAVIKAVVDHTDRPVTVKMRAGWDKDHINCAEIAQLAEKAGASAIAVHGRTKTQGYTGHADNQYIKMVKDAVSIPVIGNGDIKTAEDAKRMMAETNCDAIMIGRGLLGRPYFLKELNAALKGTEYAEPTYEEKLALCYDYAKRLCAYEGEYNGIPMMRGMAGWYLAGMPYAARYKSRLSQVNTLQEIKDILNEYKDQLGK
ncbi:MAG: tRNA dihydrouridine synthase DusB [Solobacterium sp.]|nr:tRNA dihydrouridine synthase DusB [Solobacterium sp.]MCH4206497.1 tRNA dihydrouridine synthase DusB [Solobacterium sp.]MCH4282804.1 tRNA dihydrouridine synthase DusB [Solobacterium sp.]